MSDRIAVNENIFDYQPDAKANRIHSVLGETPVNAPVDTVDWDYADLLYYVATGKEPVSELDYNEERTWKLFQKAMDAIPSDDVITQEHFLNMYTHKLAKAKEAHLAYARDYGWSTSVTIDNQDAGSQYAKAYKDFLNRTDISPIDKIIFLCLRMHQHGNWDKYAENMSYARISAETGIPVGTVKDALKRMHKKHMFVKRYSGKNSPCWYKCLPMGRWG
jgi:hypothetical protein